MQFFDGAKGSKMCGLAGEDNVISMCINFRLLFISIFYIICI